MSWAAERLGMAVRAFPRLSKGRVIKKKFFERQPAQSLVLFMESPICRRKGTQQFHHENPRIPNLLFPLVILPLDGSHLVRGVG